MCVAYGGAVQLGDIRLHGRNEFQKLKYSIIILYILNQGTFY